MNMHARRWMKLLGVSALMLAIQTNAENSAEPKENNMNPTPKEQVAQLLKSIETGDAAPIAYVNPNKYIQHNLVVGDGLAGFGAVLQQLPAGSAKVNTARLLQDGEYVVAHTVYNFFGPKIGFDVFRFENGKIVEHWDNLQPTPDQPNPSGRTMTDGTAEVTDLEKTDSNKALVTAFVNDVLISGKLDKLSSYFDGDNYLQHNPAIADGLSGLGAALKAMAEQGITMKYSQVHKVLGQGNFVLVISEGEFAGKPTSFYDLFRVHQGKIAEHWDTMETIPARADWKNQNGKFGFK
jgi:predicted SnoaL-like aldol condensation-catalyzing enzyme